MNIKLYHILLLVLSVGMISCDKDNYDEPSSTLSGKLVYQGETFGLEKDQVPFELYQYGFGKVGPIGAAFTQEGTYSAVLFDGEYKLIIPNGQGPFLWKKTAGGAPDSVTISLKGNQQLDLEVTPFYLIRSPQISASGGKVNATFSVAKIITGADARDIEHVALYINKTQFVSSNNDNKIADAGLGGGAIVDPNNISLQVDIPNIVPAQNYLFARIGLKVAGVEDRIYSPLVKIEF